MRSAIHDVVRSCVCVCVCHAQPSFKVLENIVADILPKGHAGLKAIFFSFLFLLAQKA